MKCIKIRSERISRKRATKCNFFIPKLVSRVFYETYHMLSKKLLYFYSFEKNDVWGATEMKSPDDESNQILATVKYQFHELYEFHELYQFHEKAGISGEGLNTGTEARSN